MATVLVIDDEIAVRELIQQTLSTTDYEVYTASKGMSGLAMFWHYRPDLVIVGLVKPIKDALQVIREIRRQLPKQKIFALLGNENGLDVAFATGADDVLVKPFDARVLLEKIKGCLG